MLRRISAWLAVILVIAAITGGLGYYKFNEIQAGIAAAQANPEPMESVASARARAGEWSATTRAIGSVVAMRQVEIKNEIAGVIANIGFKSGDVVEKDALLVQFDTRQEEASLAAAEADARLAKLTLDRRESLRDSAAFNQQELDRAREDFAAATARAKNLSVIVDKKRITAPFRARVGITDWQGVAEDAYVDFSLPQDSTAIVRTGTLVTLSGAAVPGGEAKAEIIAEDNSADSANRAVRFRAVAKGFGQTLRPGSFVDVTAVTSMPQPTVLVPLSSIRRSPSGQHVFVLVDEEGKLRARMRQVETGAIDGDDIAVSKGVAIGELIASQGSFKLREGMQVEAAPATPTAEVGVN
jgi:membrane fusion protein, multidrug efflux system